MIYEKKDGKTVHEYLKGNLCGSGQHFLLLLQRLVPCGGVCSTDRGRANPTGGLLCLNPGEVHWYGSHFVGVLPGATS